MTKRLFTIWTLAFAVALASPLLRAQDQQTPPAQPAQSAQPAQDNQAAPPADQTPAQPAAQTPAQPLVEEPDASAQPDSGGGPNGTQIVIPEGTEFKLQLHSSLNSKVTKPGDRVMTTLLDPVSVEDEDVLGKGVRIDGHVSEVKEAARRGRGGDLMVVFDTIEMPSGEKVAIQGSLTEVFSSNGGSEKVGAEGDLKGKGASHKEQAALVVAPAALGAAGGLGPGIAAGAAGIAMAYFIPKGKQALLLSGSLIGMRLDRDVTVTLPGPASPPVSK